LIPLQIEVGRMRAAFQLYSTEAIGGKIHIPIAPEYLLHDELNNRDPNPRCFRPCPQSTINLAVIEQSVAAYFCLQARSIAKGRSQPVPVPKFR
jgi:hypothetical protein